MRRQTLSTEGVVNMKVAGHLLRLQRCSTCKASPGICDKSGCDGRHPAGWRRTTGGS